LQQPYHSKLKPTSSFMMMMMHSNSTNNSSCSSSSSSSTRTVLLHKQKQLQLQRRNHLFKVVGFILYSLGLVSLVLILLMAQRLESGNNRSFRVLLNFVRDTRQRSYFPWPCFDSGTSKRSLTQNLLLSNSMYLLPLLLLPDHLQTTYRMEKHPRCIGRR
jgi:glycopeptide antibiotics resistance protein